MNSPTMATTNRWLKLSIVILFISGVSAFFLFGGNEVLSLNALRDNRDALLGYTQEHYARALLLAILIYATATAMSFPGATVLSLAVGFLFGRWVGTAIILIAATLGATMVFLAARYLLADTLRKKLNSGMAAKLIKGFSDDAFHYLLFLRLVPIFPFWLVNLAPAFTSIKIRTYILGTAIGILPGCFIFANLGQSLGRIESLQQLLSLETLLAFALLGLFALVPVIIKKVRNPVTNKDTQ